MLRRIFSAKLAVVVPVAALALGIGIAVALGAFRTSVSSEQDIAATRTYVHARYALEQMYQANVASVRAAAKAFSAGIRSNCAGVLKGAPESSWSSRGRRNAFEAPAESELIRELTNAFDITLRQPSDHALRNFVDGVSHLSWSDRRITNLVQSFADTEAATLRRRLPAVCADMRAWVASGYRRLPVGPRRAEPRLEALRERLANDVVALGYRTGHPERTVLQVLKRYQSPSERLASSRVDQLEVKLGALEVKLWLRSMVQLELALGLPRCRSSLVAHRPQRARPTGPSLASGCR